VKFSLKKSATKFYIFSREIDWALFIGIHWLRMRVIRGHRKYFICCWQIIRRCNCKPWGCGWSTDANF